MHRDPILGDSGSWIQPAVDILSGNGFGDTHRTPLYPFFIALVYAVFGAKPMAIVYVQALIGAMTCVLIYLAGKRIFNPLAGMISALLVVCYPYLIYYTGVVMAETLFAFLITLTVYMLLYAGDNEKLSLWAFSGISLGLTALCKPVILVFSLFICFWMWFALADKKRAMVSILVLGIATTAVILPWTSRNYLKYNAFILISTGGQDFWLSNNDVAMSLETSPDLDMSAPDKWVWFPKERHAEISKMPKLEADRVFWKEGKEWIRDNPDKFAWLLPKRLLHFWRLWPKMASSRDKMLAKMTSGIYFPLAFAGVILSFRRYWKKTLLLILLFVSFTAAYLPFYCMVRYRVPLDPIVLIFTGYVLAEAVKKVFPKTTNFMN